ncbi:MAG: AmmeMemoRadiSam system protein B [Planctomycetota bacterium]
MSEPDEAANGSEKPRLRRDLKVLPAQAGGAQALVIQDPAGILEKPMVVGGQALELLPLLDGRHSILDLQTELTRRYGILVSGDQVRKVLAKLDESYLLESPRYREALARTAREFAAGTFLPPAHAGDAYPGDPDVLKGWAKGLLASAESEGTPASGIRAAVAPHIDLRVGGDLYAAAYAPLRGAEFDRVVVLGVGHTLREGLVALTDKDVITPLGKLVNDRELTAALRARAKIVGAPDDLAFRGEHSVEFQIVLLQQVLGKTDFKVVPILFGAFEPLLDEYDRAGSIPGLDDVLGVLADAAGDERTLLVAGVDLSHVGPKFGDSMSSRAIAAESEEHDRALLDALCSRDPGAFWAEGRRVGGKFNVCGFGALACLVEVLPEGCGGRLAGYRTWHEESTRSGVSFAAVIFAP